MVLLTLRREEQGKVGLRYGPTKSSQRRVGVKLRVGLRYGLLSLRREEQGKVVLRYGRTKFSQRRVG